ncbi:MAG TPA: plasmid pRiA4b ORF-3 family protein [Desulfosporosinus sp.]|nr:plasmid pRiA4b ORF-3 family protein [Desulfosporosinus sp.]
MKAYIIKIGITHSDPIIWRRVIMPAGATFNRLHDVMQNITNFQSSSYEDYHLYKFDLSEENIRVTNDEEASLNNLSIVVKKPKGLKIDHYLEKYGVINYTYDFGDNWELDIKLEGIVDDYYFGYPTLLEGAETAPPEDIGGLPSYYEFLEIYHDDKHPNYEEIKAWSKEQGFQEYDPDHINAMLKFIQYKKTEWDKINHQNYRIIDDKYRK